MNNTQKTEVIIWQKKYVIEYESSPITHKDAWTSCGDGFGFMIMKQTLYSEMLSVYAKIYHTVSEKNRGMSITDIIK
jgi:hypothetical protein